MITAKTALAGLAIGFAVASIGLSAASAQTRAHRTQAAQRSPIHECSVRASKYKDYADELMHMYTFRTCMARRGMPGD